MPCQIINSRAGKRRPDTMPETDEGIDDITPTA